ncbi:oxidoreductase molybdopterin binding protein [Thermocrinis albus DSM 14484]|uniref:Oxidoreductase molybdopterin binding protein n=1 Tax=Thermocrinis albus (strain DSM 14484 / JCM 11386 / HI 11/12) TaxID=638303 RepID=D3SPY7_THEAH|nr:sulfite oxidase-like oxidoreductase [Thermocrinis albus]ADC89224.1 oxidoreductase molybdopterin binding protein [Thermocrinis albus DSM 14484]
MKRRIVSPCREREDRLPPGQRWISSLIPYDIVDEVPDWDMSSYRLKVWGLVEEPIELSYEDILRLPSVELLADFHCVTRWSVKDLLWEGVPTALILSMAKLKPEGRYALIHCLEGYTTNVPVEYLLMEDSILAYKLGGKPLPKRHGFPLRLVIPSLYAWKSAKYVWGIEILQEDTPGFWEQRGYHMRGDPWKEERYW